MVNLCRDAGPMSAPRVRNGRATKAVGRGAEGEVRDPVIPEAIRNTGGLCEKRCPNVARRSPYSTRIIDLRGVQQRYGRGTATALTDSRARWTPRRLLLPTNAYDQGYSSHTDYGSNGRSIHGARYRQRVGDDDRSLMA
jgi:hypothetical protein